ncbi:MAG TPA: ferritin-like domain-containing protein [Sulfuricurvum sp.]|nr:ferritin-like domain-containing protein [Sulfuricurvum sp.]
MELYATLEHVLTIQQPSEKINAFKLFYSHYSAGNVHRQTAAIPREFDKPSYHGFCSICDPKEVPKRTKLGTAHGQILLLHAIAHIEYSAIDLALDAAYRFRDMGDEFISDWLKVADDEVRHFEMIDALLQELGSYYGEHPVHDALFEASQRTVNVLERMAVVPRYLEANGLDATPLILKKLEQYQQDPMVSKIMKALQIILDEEVDHVLRGDRWFHVACEQENVHPDIYFEIIERHYPKSFPRKVAINCDARKCAGFECRELEKISLVKC